MTDQKVIDAIRERLVGRTQEQLADELGIDQTTLSRILNHQRNPSKQVLERLGLRERKIIEPITRKNKF